MADRAGAEIVGQGLRLGDQLAQARGEVGRTDRRRASRRADQDGEHSSFDVVKDVAGIADEGVLIAGHACERTELEQQAHDRHEVGALLASAQLEDDARRGEPFVARAGDDPLGEPAERDLCVSALEHGQRQAEQHVAPAAKRDV